MTSTRNSRDDVVRAAGRLFAERGYHGTSMRDLGRELGLHGSSLYSHITSKEDLLVDVVRRGAELFERSAATALAGGRTASEQLGLLIAGHIDVVLDHLDEARTFLNEARSLDSDHRDTVVAARDRYENVFRDVLRRGVEDGTFSPDLDIPMATIYVLSILNSIDRWYRPEGRLDRRGLKESIIEFVGRAVDPARSTRHGTIPVT